MKLTLLLTFLGSAAAKCPNGCSGNGMCGEHDMCSCYTNWVGADCSQRQCLSGPAWITTSRGDVNYDGDKLDSTTFHSDHHFKATSVEYLVDQFSPGGTWEAWPSTFAKNLAITDPTNVNYALDEGHFYMECSNRGHCDRKTGQCECFPGYTGENCRRTVCPEDCSGHGRCQTVAQQSGSFTYNLWDKDMSRSCVCDPGFTGPACAERSCPIGDDPLTTLDMSRNEVQWVDVYTDDADDSGTDGPFSGSIRFEYTDYHGETWVTDPVAVEPADGSMSAYNAMAADAEIALEGLPNNVLRDVQVNVGMCDTVVPGDKTIGDADSDDLTTTAFYNARSHTTNQVLQVDAAGDAFTFANSLSTYTSYPDTANPTAYAGGAFTGTIYKNENANCVRFQIYFVSTPGNLNELVVDTSGVTVTNQDTNVDETTDQGATSIGHRSTDQRSLGGVASAFITNGRVLECSGADAANTCSTDGSNEITIGSGVTHWVNTYDRIELECGGKKIGTYTVSVATVPTATVITTDEVIPTCEGSATSKLKISVVTNTIWVDGDLTDMGLVGGYVKLGIWSIGPVEAVYWQPGVSELTRDIADATDIGPFGGRLFIGGAGLPNQPDGNPYSAYTGDTSIKQVGRGQSEMSECSDRGVCDTDSGVCKCFGGYTGNACELQSALSA